MVLRSAAVLDDRERAIGTPAAGAVGRIGAYRALGLVGSLVVVAGGVLAGVTPVGDVAIESPVVLALRASVTLSVFVVYVGLTVLLLAWWRIGAAAGAPGGPNTRELTVTAAWWAAPFVLITPIFSGDVYSYLAQGAMTMAGLDAYRVGPAAMGGPLTVNVPDIWQHTPAPYGPVFLDLAGAITKITGGDVWAGIVGMRVLAVLGIGLLIWAVPRLAGFCGVRPESAMWLGVLNPLVLLHLVGDAHNEALMLGPLCSGLVLALRRRPVLGVIAITLAALVKAPAGLAIAFVVPIWASQLTGERRWLRAAPRAVGVAAVTAVTVTALAGTGFGWARTLDTPTRARTWMSITTDIGWAVGTLVRHVSGVSVDETRRTFWMLGLVVAAVVGFLLWRRSERLGPVTALGLALGVLVMAGPVVHPWYLLWAVVPLAAAAPDGVIRRTMAFGSAALVLLVLPGGVQPGVQALVGAVLGASAVFVAAALHAGLNRQRLRAAVDADYVDRRFHPVGPVPIAQSALADLGARVPTARPPA